MNPRHLRKPFRRALQMGRAMPQRLNRLPVIPAAAIGAASMIAISVGGHPGDGNPAGAQRASVIDLPAGSYVAGERAGVPVIDGGKGGARHHRSSGKHGATAVNPYGVANPAGEGKTPDGPGASAKSARSAKSGASAKSAASGNGAASAKSAAPGKGAASAKPVRPAKPAPGKVELYYQYRVQTTGFYCGPAASRMAVSARGHYPSQDTLARQLGTTENGTNSVADITRVLNAVNKTSFYHPTKLPAKPATRGQADKLRTDVVHAVSNGFPVVMNVVGTGYDTGGSPHAFDGGHYITVVGYADHGRRAKIGDSANPATNSYWISTKNLADWAGHRGYAS